MGCVYYFSDWRTPGVGLVWLLCVSVVSYDSCLWSSISVLGHIFIVRFHASYLHLQLHVLWDDCWCSFAILIVWSDEKKASTNLWDWKCCSSGSKFQLFSALSWPVICSVVFSSLARIASLATILVALMVSYFVLCSSGLKLISRVSRSIGLESGYQGVIVKFPIELVLCTSRWPIGFGNPRSIKFSWMFFVERYWQIAFVGSPRRLERSHPKILLTDNFCQMWNKDLALQSLVTLWASSWSNAKSDCYGFTNLES